MPPTSPQTTRQATTNRTLSEDVGARRSVRNATKTKLHVEVNKTKVPQPVATSNQYAALADLEDDTPQVHAGCADCTDYNGLRTPKINNDVTVVHDLAIKAHVPTPTPADTYTAGTRESPTPTTLSDIVGTPETPEMTRDETTTEEESPSGSKSVPDEEISDSEVPNLRDDPTLGHIVEINVHRVTTESWRMPIKVGTFRGH